MKDLTEHEMTVAVDAAARALWDQHKGPGPEPLPPFDDLHFTSKNGMREQVMPIVLAAIEACPDRAEALRLQIRTEAQILRGHGHRAMSLEQLDHLIGGKA